ncbi:MAG: hypothetical protein K2H13_00745 [Eubacterium sp.]|nr:hypothetical protein [Eubacterium sp.]
MIKKHQTSVDWHTLDKTIKFISLPVYNNLQRKFLQARDIAALKEYTKNNLME